MRYIEPITEHDMVVVFLKTEIHSTGRYDKEILALLERDGVSRKIIDEPDMGNPEENDYRIQLLGDFRGYKQNRGLFECFPDDVSWYRGALSKDELARTRYIDYSYWNVLSGGSRLPVDAAKNIRAGIEVFGESTQWGLEMAQALEAGAVFPELILVGCSPESGLVVLEGHVRLTAYILALEHIPEELNVIVGFSANMGDWMDPVNSAD